MYLETAWVVYKTDAQHSFGSRDVIGICTDLPSAIGICKEKATQDGGSIDSDDLFNLNNIKQTQGYLGEGEFDIEELSLNRMI